MQLEARFPPNNDSPVEMFGLDIDVIYVVFHHDWVGIASALQEKNQSEGKCSYEASIDRAKLPDEIITEVEKTLDWLLSALPRDHEAWTTKDTITADGVEAPMNAIFNEPAEDGVGPRCCRFLITLKGLVEELEVMLNDWIHSDAVFGRWMGKKYQLRNLAALVTKSKGAPQR